MAITNPSVAELLEHADCRYTLVVKVSKRARQLVGGAPPLIDTKETKAVSIAVEEVGRGLVDHTDAPQESGE